MTYQSLLLESPFPRAELRQLVDHVNGDLAYPSRGLSDTYHGDCDGNF